MLQRAGQVIETQEITVDPNSIPKPVKKKGFLTMLSDFRG